MLEYYSVGSVKQDGCILMGAQVCNNRVFWRNLTIVAKLLLNLLINEYTSEECTYPICDPVIYE